jgi:hypothetical protein
MADLSDAELDPLSNETAVGLSAEIDGKPETLWRRFDTNDVPSGFILAESEMFQPMDSVEDGRCVTLLSAVPSPLSGPMSNTTTAPAASMPITPITPRGMTIVSEGRRPVYRAHLTPPLTPEAAVAAMDEMTGSELGPALRLGVDIDYTNSWLVISVPTEMPPDPERLRELEALMAEAPGVTRVERLP